MIYEAWYQTGTSSGLGLGVRFRGKEVELSGTCFGHAGQGELGTVATICP